jgi:hypothetical protein
MMQAGRITSFVMRGRGFESSYYLISQGNLCAIWIACSRVHEKVARSRDRLTIVDRRLGTLPLDAVGASLAGSDTSRGTGRELWPDSSAVARLPDHQIIASARNIETRPSRDRRGISSACRPEPFEMRRVSGFPASTTRKSPQRRSSRPSLRRTRGSK